MSEDDAVLTVTDKARTQILEIRAQEPDADDLALSVEVSGIVGGSYAYELTFMPMTDAGPDDVVVSHDDLSVVVPRGSVEKLSAEESDAYFATRPLGARLSAWASAQSERVPDRATLEAAMEEARRRHGERPLRPPHWGGYRVIPQSIEFWQGRADRLHDRLLYTRGGGGWRIERLAP